MGLPLLVLEMVPQDKGSLHETFNMAMLWKLPVVFIVENNGYAMGNFSRKNCKPY